mmetsp:Transcript_164591/g.528006  ORF Transcript_164591/g.528006 Transcript_164591/m.528006 type:complete len:201 (+) Transcript_164591:197-799(+)
MVPTVAAPCRKSKRRGGAQVMLDLKALRMTSCNFQPAYASIAAYWICSLSSVGLCHLPKVTCLGFAKYLLRRIAAKACRLRFLRLYGFKKFFKSTKPSTLFISGIWDKCKSHTSVETPTPALITSGLCNNFCSFCFVSKDTPAGYNIWKIQQSVSVASCTTAVGFRPGANRGVFSISKPNTFEDSNTSQSIKCSVWQLTT